MNRAIAITLALCGTLPGCQTLLPDRPGAVERGARGTLSVRLRWPERRVQTIPISTQIIRLRVLKNGVVVSELPISRPSSTNPNQSAQGSLQLDAGTGLTVQAEAFRASPIASGDVPIASASVTGVGIFVNQKTTVTLNLVPVFVPTLTGLSPSNGGPGVAVTLSGAFGGSGYYGMGLAGLISSGRASGGAIVATVPFRATTGPAIALADGVPSAGGATFSVLAGLGLTPSAGATTVGNTVQFSVPTGTDTSSPSLTIANPTITGWDVVDPAQLVSPNAPTRNVGSIDSNGLFTAKARGTVWVRAFSGYLVATASITVN